MTRHTRTVQEIYAAFGRGDVDAIVRPFADDIHFVHAGGPAVPYAKDRHGKAEAADFFADLARSVEVIAFEVRQYVEQGDSVVALGTWGGRARATGKEFASEWAMLWTFRGDEVARYRAYENTAAVAEAFGA